MKGPPTASSFKIWESGLTCKERTARMDAYDSAKKEYRQEIDEYVRKNGYENLTQSKLRALLAGNLIQSTGGKRLMQWRWQRFCEGKTVVRSKHYLKECGLPEYTHLTPVSCVGFAGLPLNVWEYHIFPFMDDRALWNIMLTSKQLQARAHNALMSRAQREFGAGGTPMAIWCKLYKRKASRRRRSRDYFHDKLYLERRELLSSIRMTILKFGCMDHCKHYAEFCAQQKIACKKDRAKNDEFMDQAIARINSVTPEELHLRRSGLYNVGFVERHLHLFPQNYLTACKRFVNTDERNTQKIKKKLATLQPDVITLTLVLKTRHIEFVDMRRFLRVLNYQAVRKGVEWLEQLVITQDFIEKHERFDPYEGVYIVDDNSIDIVESDHGMQYRNHYDYNADVVAYFTRERPLKKLKC